MASKLASEAKSDFTKSFVMAKKPFLQLSTVLAKRVCHGLREFQQSLCSRMRKGNRGGKALATAKKCLLQMGPSSISPSNSDVHTISLTGSDCYSHVSLCEVNACCMLVSWNKERGREEEEKIDVDLDFEAAKSTKTLCNSCRCPVTEMSKEGEECRPSSLSAGPSYTRPSGSVRPFLSPVLAPDRPPLAHQAPGPPPPHLVFICVTSRAACLPSMFHVSALCRGGGQMPSRLSPLSANCYAKIEEILATHDELFWPTLYTSLYYLSSVIISGQKTVEIGCI